MIIFNGFCNVVDVYEFVDEFVFVFFLMVFVMILAVFVVMFLVIIMSYGVCFFRSLGCFCGLFL